VIFGMPSWQGNQEQRHGQAQHEISEEVDVGVTGMPAAILNRRKCLAGEFVPHRRAEIEHGLIPCPFTLERSEDTEQRVDAAVEGRRPRRVRGPVQGRPAARR